MTKLKSNKAADTRDVRNAQKGLLTGTITGVDPDYRYMTVCPKVTSDQNDAGSQTGMQLKVQIPNHLRKDAMEGKDGITYPDASKPYERERDGVKESLDVPYAVGQEISMQRLEVPVLNTKSDGAKERINYGQVDPPRFTADVLSTSIITAPAYVYAKDSSGNEGWVEVEPFSCPTE